MGFLKLGRHVGGCRSFRPHHRACGRATTSCALLPVAAVVLGRRAVRHTCSHVFQLNRLPQQDRECRFLSTSEPGSRPVFFFAQSLSTTAHALFPVPAWRWVMARAPVQPESSIGGNGGLTATALQEDRNFTDDVRSLLKIW